MLEIPQVIEIIKKWGLSIKMEINKILRMERRNDIIIDAINNTPIREDWRNKRDQISKYTIPKNGDYHVNHDWHKNQKLREKVAIH